MPYQYGAGAAGAENLATPGKRILARIIDWLILTVVIAPLAILAIVSTGDTNTTSSTFEANFGLGASLLLTFVPLVLVGAYEVVFVALKGQTPGKMLMKVRVVRADDHQIPGWGPATMRWVPSLVQLVPCVGSFLGLGLWIWALVNLFSNPRRQTPFDLAAKTVVLDAS